jgi:hypothetical protein
MLSIASFSPRHSREGRKAKDEMALARLLQSTMAKTLKMGRCMLIRASRKLAIAITVSRCNEISHELVTML